MAVPNFETFALFARPYRALALACVVLPGVILSGLCSVISCHVLWLSYLVMTCLVLLLVCLILSNHVSTPLSTHTHTPSHQQPISTLQNTAHTQHSTHKVRSCLVLFCRVLSYFIILLCLFVSCVSYLASKRVQTHNRIKLRVRIGLSLGLMYRHVHPCKKTKVLN